jgi:hypothetical protein
MSPAIVHHSSRRPSPAAGCFRPGVWREVPPTTADRLRQAPRLGLDRDVLRGG